MEPTYYIGLDVHKRKISYCVKDSGDKVYAASISVSGHTKAARLRIPTNKTNK